MGHGGDADRSRLSPDPAVAQRNCEGFAANHDGQQWSGQVASKAQRRSVAHLNKASKYPNAS